MNDGTVHHVDTVTVLDSVIVLDGPTNTTFASTEYPLEIQMMEIKSVEELRGTTSAKVAGFAFISVVAATIAFGFLLGTISMN
jgi:hypothetical protein